MSPLQLALSASIGAPLGTTGPAPTAPGSPGAAGGFGAALEQAIGQVDAAQKQADAAATGFAAGKVKDVHEVVLAIQQADLSLRLALEVRNKVVEAWQDVSRMQA